MTTKKKKKQKTVHISKLKTISMVNGNENKYPVVIDGDEIRQWIGFGWVIEGPAEPEDYEKYPVIVRD